MTAPRVLWVEDEFNDLRGLVRPLQLRGVFVEFVGDYESARGLLDKGAIFDLFIVDVIIPEWSADDRFDHGQPRENVGLDLIKDIREKYRLKGVPILVLSVVTQERVLSKAREFGATILTKGVISPSELEAEVVAALRISPAT